MSAPAMLRPPPTPVPASPLGPASHLVFFKDAPTGYGRGWRPDPPGDDRPPDEPPLNRRERMVYLFLAVLGALPFLYLLGIVIYAHTPYNAN